MKITLIALSLLVSFSSFAKDMSKTERGQEVHEDQADGSILYVGGCSVHQDYEDKAFKVGKKLVESFEPDYDKAVAIKEVKKAFKNIEPELVLALQASTTLQEAYENMAGTDDISLEKIISTKFKGLDLYRYNVGVGGGNGYYTIFNRTEVKGKVVFEHMAMIFDGDLEFCDSKVWLKK